MKQGWYAKAAIRKCFSKLVFFKISRYLQLYKRDSNTGVFLWILRDLYEQLLCGTPPVAAFGYCNQSKLFRHMTASKFQGQHIVQFNFGRYEGMCPPTKTEIIRGCFQWDFAKF